MMIEIRIALWTFLWFGAVACNLSSEQAVVKQAGLSMEELPTLQDKKILMVYGGWPGHQPQKYTELVGKLLQAQGAVVSISDSLGVYRDSAFLSSVDLIIQSVTMDKIKPEEIEGLLRAVKEGGVGFAGAHGGFSDSFRENTEYQYMTGGQFVAHPGGQVDFNVHITDTSNLITKGITDFDTHTEQYYMHVDPNVNVLATTTFSGAHHQWIDGVVMPVIWTKYFGKGRIFYISLGHDPSEFDTKPAQTLLMNGLRWASGSKYGNP